MTVFSACVGRRYPRNSGSSDFLCVVRLTIAGVCGPTTFTEARHPVWGRAVVSICCAPGLRHYYGAFVLLTIWKCSLVCHDRNITYSIHQQNPPSGGLFELGAQRRVVDLNSAVMGIVGGRETKRWMKEAHEVKVQDAHSARGL